MSASDPSFLDGDFDAAMKMKRDRRQRVWPTPPRDVVESKVVLVQNDTAAEDDSLSSDFQNLSKISRRRNEDSRVLELSHPDRQSVLENLSLLNDTFKQRRPSLGLRASIVRQRLKTENEIEVEDIDSISKQNFDSSPSLMNDLNKRRPSLGPRASNLRQRLKTENEIEVEKQDNRVPLVDQNCEIIVTPTFLLDDDEEEEEEEVVTSQENNRPLSSLLSSSAAKYQTEGRVGRENVDVYGNLEESPERILSSNKRRPSFQSKGASASRMNLSNKFLRQYADRTSVEMNGGHKIVEEKQRRPSLGPRPSNAAVSRPSELVRYLKFEKSKSDMEAAFENSPTLLSSREAVSMKNRRPSFGPSIGSRAYSSLRSVKSRVVDPDAETKMHPAHPPRRLSATKKLERTLLRSLGLDLESLHSDQDMMPSKSCFDTTLSMHKQTLSTSLALNDDDGEDNERSSSSRRRLEDSITTTKGIEIDRKIKEFIRVRRQLRKSPRSPMKPMFDEEERNNRNEANLEWRMLRVKRAVLNAREY